MESNENNKIEIPKEQTENNEKIAAFCNETFASLIQPKEIKSIEKLPEDQVISFPQDFEIKEELTDEEIAEFYEYEIWNLKNAEDEDY